MKIERFEDIIAWQKSKELTFKVYSLFSESKDFGFNIEPGLKRVEDVIPNEVKESFQFDNQQIPSSFLLGMT